MSTTTPTSDLADRLRDRLPASLRPLAQEIATYYHALPQLLADGHAVRIVRIHRDSVVNVYDTDEDAITAGHERFGLSGFLAQPVDERGRDQLDALLGT